MTDAAGFLVWVEASALGQLMRQSGPWAYAMVNLAHILGVATLFGSVLVLDLRLLGIARHIPLAPLVSAVTPVSAAGLLLALLSGAGLIAARATDYIGNPFLLIKFPAIALGLVNVALLRRTAGWQALSVRPLTASEGRRLTLAGGISLTSWLTAVAAGRLIGYW